MSRPRRRAITLQLAVLATALSLTGASVSQTSAERIPDRLADSTFWRMVTDYSEPSGVFPSENFVSNETEWQRVIPRLLETVKPGGVYLGVGPEQNFTYIAALKPEIAFICDIRRQNLIEHLMYKALIEMSSDRADLLSKLWSRRRPENLDASSSPAALLAAYRDVKADSMTFVLNLGAIFDRLVNAHKFALTPDDSVTLRAVYATFYINGPEISYASRSQRNGSLTAPQPGGFIPAGAPFRFSVGSVTTSLNGATVQYSFTVDSAGRMIVLRDSAGTMVGDTTLKLSPVVGPSTSPFMGSSFSMYSTFAELMTLDDGAGVNRGWLGSESAFQWLKDFQKRNLIVPVVGNFSGPKALRAVAKFVRDHESRVSAFYTSNVEQYLFQQQIHREFYANVAELPKDSASMFIRSIPNMFGRGMNFGGRPLITQTTSPIATVLDAFRDGLLNGYNDLAQLQDVPRR